MQRGDMDPVQQRGVSSPSLQRAVLGLRLHTLQKVATFNLLQS